LGKREEDLVRSLISGRTLTQAAREAGLDEARAKSFLESVADFAGAVGAPMEFGAPEEAAAHEQVVLYTDGASSGNPGPSGAGGVILTPGGETLGEFREHLGRTTNNVAEYEAVRIGLAKALSLGARRVHVRLDSKLVANQLSGRYKIKDAKLIDRYLEVERLVSRFDEVSFEAIPREENSRADRLAQAAARMAA